MYDISLTIISYLSNEQQRFRARCCEFYLGSGQRVMMMMMMLMMMMMMTITMMTITMIMMMMIMMMMCHFLVKSWNCIYILKAEMKVKWTTARTGQSTSKGSRLSIRYFDWPIAVFIRFIRPIHEFSEYIYCKIITGSTYDMTWYGVARYANWKAKNVYYI